MLFKLSDTTEDDLGCLFFVIVIIVAIIAAVRGCRCNDSTQNQEVIDQHIAEEPSKKEILATSKQPKVKDKVLFLEGDWKGKTGTFVELAPNHLSIKVEQDVLSLNAWRLYYCKRKWYATIKHTKQIPMSTPTPK